MKDRLVNRKANKHLKKFVKYTCKLLKKSLKEGTITHEGIMEACERLRDDLYDFK